MGSATGKLGSFGIGSALGANHEVGDIHSGGEKSGPTVQASSISSSTAAVGNRLNTTPVQAARGRCLTLGSNREFPGWPERQAVNTSACDDTFREAGAAC